MIDFEEELKRFKPAMEVEDAADVIRRSDLTDMIDIMKKLTEEKNTPADGRQ